MTAQLVNLKDGKPADVISIGAALDVLPSVSALMRDIRTPGLTTADGMAEWRVWGSSARTIKAVQQTID